MRERRKSHRLRWRIIRCTDNDVSITAQRGDCIMAAVV